MSPDWLNISVQSRVAAQSFRASFYISPQSSMASKRRDDIARRTTEEQRDPDGCIRIARDRP